MRRGRRRRRVCASRTARIRCCGRRSSSREDRSACRAGSPRDACCAAAASARRLFQPCRPAAADRRASNCSNGSSARATIRLGSTSGTAHAGCRGSVRRRRRPRAGWSTAARRRRALGPSPVRTPGAGRRGGAPRATTSGRPDPVPPRRHRTPRRTRRRRRSGPRPGSPASAAPPSTARCAIAAPAAAAPATNPAGPLAATATPAARTRATSATANAARSTPRKQQRRGHPRRRDARPNANTSSSASDAPATTGPYFFSAVAAGQFEQVDRGRLGCRRCAGRVVGPVAGGRGKSAASCCGGGLASDPASLASRDSTNWPSSFSETCCSMPLPNCASFPTIFRSVSTVTRLRLPFGMQLRGDDGGRVAGAARLPALGVDHGPVVVRGRARRSAPCRVNSLVTGPTLTLTLPR